MVVGGREQKASQFQMEEKGVSDGAGLREQGRVLEVLICCWVADAGGVRVAQGTRLTKGKNTKRARERETETNQEEETTTLTSLASTGYTRHHWWWSDSRHTHTEARLRETEREIQEIQGVER